MDSRFRWGVLAVWIFLFAYAGTQGDAAYAQGTLSGSNALTLSLSNLDLSTLSLSDTLSITYRVNRLSISGHSVYSKAGLTSQSFRLSTPLGDFTMQGSMSFSATSFTRANLALSGRWEGVPFTVSLLIAQIGSTQTPSYDFGSTIRLSGTVPDLGRLSMILGIGATPFGHVEAGYGYEGMRVSWGNLVFCGGTANLDFLFDQTGLYSETVSWSVPIPFCDFKIRISLRYLDLFDFQGLAAGVRGTIGDLKVSGNFAFDSIQTFSRGVWSLSGPFFGGTLAATTTIDKDTLLSQAFTWSYQSDGFSVRVTPDFQITSFDGQTLVFDIPSVKATFWWELVCCDGIAVGDLSVSIALSKESFEQISVTYSYAF